MVSEPVVSSTRFIYDEAGLLVGEAGPGSRAYVWMDDLLVAVADEGAAISGLSLVYSDRLGAPRAVKREGGEVVWRWAYLGNAFGELAPSSSSFELNLRFPGQYYDVESGLVYNTHRTYDSATGRYVQSDPLGLEAGPNTYAYASSDPLNRKDSQGLDDGYCRINPSWCGWANPKPSVSNVAVGANQTGVAAVLGEQTETGFAFDSTPNVCVYSKVCGMAATGAGAGGSAGIAGGVGTGALSSGVQHTASFTAQTGNGPWSGFAIDVDVASGQISASHGFLGIGSGAYVGMFVCRTVTQCAREPVVEKSCD